jgi:Family of unknown function (DUF6519)
MKGDFTRDTFHVEKHFSRVLMQQGRVTLDADYNEQTAIDLHYLRTLARDVIGPYAAPAGVNGGFLLKVDSKNVFSVSQGRYYVDGILIENDSRNCTYKHQPDYPVSDADDPLLEAIQKNDTKTEFGIYLDVWERHITTIEDDSIRETALGGPDTCTRAKVVWQIRALSLTEDEQRKTAEIAKKVSGQLEELWKNKAQLEKEFIAESDKGKQVALLKQLQLLDEELARLTQLSFLRSHEVLLSRLIRLSNAKLAARVDHGQKIDDACVTPPASKYRGAGNQLYRVEIHQGGKIGANTPPTFKWSRDNGSVATAWLDGEGSDLQVASTRGFAAGNWVELSDDTLELLGKPGTLVQLVKVEGAILSVDPATTLPQISEFPRNPKIRRWDQVATEAVSLADDKALPIQESPAGATPKQTVWLNLENGVQIQFFSGGEYRTGDYWLIPARVATGTVEWPQADDLNPPPLPPHGTEHHYALLGFASWANEKLDIENARFEFWPLLSPVRARSSVQRIAIPTRDVSAAPRASEKPQKARKRPPKKRPASPAEGAP